MRDPMRSIVRYAHDGHDWVLDLVAVLAGAALVLVLLGAAALAQEPAAVALVAAAPCVPDHWDRMVALAEHVGIVLASVGAACSLAASKVNGMVRVVTASGRAVPARALRLFAILNVLGGNFDKASQFYSMSLGLPVASTATPAAGSARVPPPPGA